MKKKHKLIVESLNCPEQVYRWLKELPGVEKVIFPDYHFRLDFEGEKTYDKKVHYMFQGSYPFTVHLTKPLEQDELIRLINAQGGNWLRGLCAHKKE